MELRWSSRYRATGPADARTLPQVAPEYKKFTDDSKKVTTNMTALKTAQDALIKYLDDSLTVLK